MYTFVRLPFTISDQYMFSKKMSSTISNSQFVIVSLITLQVKLKAMKHQQDRLDKLYSSRQSKCILNYERLAENISNLYTDWSTVYHRIGNTWLYIRLLHTEAFSSFD